MVNVEEKKEITNKKGFFKKVKLSICNIEKYPELAIEGVPKAITYLIKLIAIFVLVLSISMIITTSKNVKEGIKYIEKEFPEFSYKEGTLDVNVEEKIKIENNEYFGKVIVDTKTEKEEEKNKYIDEINEKGNGIIILKDKMILRNPAIAGTTTFEYKDLMGQIGVQEFTKEDILNYANGKMMYSLYFSLFLVIFIYGFMIYFINTILNVVLISLFGNLAGLISKIKMRYAAIFNMSIYAVTLPIILNIIYVIINMFTEFRIEYFDVMYIAVATIYLFAAIFMVKDDLIKKQLELMKIEKVEEEVRKELIEEENKKRENKDNEEKKEGKKEENKKEEKKRERDINTNEDNNLREEPEGGKA